MAEINPRRWPIPTTPPFSATPPSPASSSPGQRSAAALRRGRAVPPYGPVGPGRGAPAPHPRDRPPTTIAATKQLERIVAEKYQYDEQQRLEMRDERLRQVEEHWYEQIVNKDENASAQGTQPELVRETNFGIDQELKSIYLSLDFNNATIEEATNFLSIESKRLDPNHKGVNFIIQPEASATAKPVTLTLNNVPLGEAPALCLPARQREEQGAGLRHLHRALHRQHRGPHQPHLHRPAQLRGAALRRRRDRKRHRGLWRRWRGRAAHRSSRRRHPRRWMKPAAIYVRQALIAKGVKFPARRQRRLHAQHGPAHVVRHRRPDGAARGARQRRPGADPHGPHRHQVRRDQPGKTSTISASTRRSHPAGQWHAEPQHLHAAVHHRAARLPRLHPRQH